MATAGRKPPQIPKNPDHLSEPRWSPALTAHLAESAGGWGISAAGFSFRDTSDSDHQNMLAAISEGAGKAREVPEVDMPEFVPAAGTAFPEGE